MFDVGIIGCAGHYLFAVESADKNHTCTIRAAAAPADGSSAVCSAAAEHGSSIRIITIENATDRIFFKTFHPFPEKFI